MSAPRFGRGFRMWMPSMPMTLVGCRNATGDKPASAVFRVLPRMTKHEITEYLTKIYKLPVAKVNTMNYEGKRKRVYGGKNNRVAYFKYRDFKKAIVTFDPSLKDIGIGTRMDIDEVEDDSV